MGLMEGAAYARSVMGAGQQAFEDGTARRERNGLRQLAGDYAAGGQPNYQGWAQNDGDPMALRQNEDQRLGQDIQAFLANPDPMAYQQFLAPRLKQRFPQVGAGADNFDPSHVEGLRQISDTLLGGGRQGPASGVQSSFVDASGQRMAIMRDGSVRPLGQNAPNNQIIDTGNGFYGVNKGDLSAAPVMVGQGAQAPQGATQAPPQGTNDGVIATANQMIAAGVPDEFVQKWIASQPGISPASEVPQGQQLRSAPKPVAPPSPRQPPAGYNWKPDGGLAPIPGGPAQVAIDARQAALDAKGTAGAVRQAEAAGQASSLIAAIDRLVGSSGFGDLGTTWGDIEQNVPLIRADAKDANAQLKNIAGQVALTTMSRLKALSAVGATGFGALTAPELKLLENSIATLQSDQISNKELGASLKIIKDSMQKVADWKGGNAPAPPGGNGIKPSAPAAGGFRVLD